MRPFPAVDGMLSKVKLTRYDRVHKGVSGRPDAQVYHGRLFFGDANSGEVVWDCDCRPSDGALFGAASPQEIFLSMMSG